MTSSSSPSKFLLYAAVMFLTLTLGCGGNSQMTKPPTTHVYAAGFMTNDVGTIATYWSDSQATIVGAGLHPSYATSIAVSGQDVYVAGVEGNGTNDVAKYWKNGKPVALTDGMQRGFAKSIVVSGNNIYVAGGEQGPGSVVAKYWKNGVPVVLRDLGEGALAQSIFIFGNDVYVAGWVNKSTQTDPTHTLHTKVAAYWRNGALVQLTNGITLALANSIFVSDGDIYVAGFACENLAAGCALAAYWKNGIQVELTDVTNTGASSIFVSGTNIYVSGNDDANTVAELWKDRVLLPLTQASLGSSANQVLVSGTDVFVAGAILNDSGKAVATYWKNGESVSLTDGTQFSSAFAVSVVAR